MTMLHLDLLELLFLHKASSTAQYEVLFFPQVCDKAGTVGPLYVA